jgi:hypothetical protein
MTPTMLTNPPVPDVGRRLVVRTYSEWQAHLARHFERLGRDPEEAANLAHVLLRDLVAGPRPAPGPPPDDGAPASGGPL